MKPSNCSEKPSCTRMAKGVKSNAKARLLYYVCPGRVEQGVVQTCRLCKDAILHLQNLRTQQAARVGRGRKWRSSSCSSQFGALINCPAAEESMESSHSSVWQSQTAGPTRERLRSINSRGVRHIIGLRNSRGWGSSLAGNQGMCSGIADREPWWQNK